MDIDPIQPEAATSRSPSPAAPPPTPSAPGPRATALQKLYNDAINHILKTCSYSNFSTCFPTPAQQVPGSLKMLHEQFTHKLGDSMRKEFESILEERNVVASLNELDRLIDDAKARKAKAASEAQHTGHKADIPTPAHTLPARQLYISHLAPTLTEFEKTMRERQHILAEENQGLILKVQQQRKDIKRLMDGLEDVVKDLNASVETLQPEHMARLKEEARAVDSVTR